MNHSSHPAVLALFFATLTTVAGAQSDSPAATATDLRGEAGAWRTVLDGVMGGRSTGQIEAAADGVIAFEGKLSLENNGGFSSMRRAVDGDLLRGSSGIVLECRGDGRKYNFDLRVASVRRMASGYRSEFSTTAGEWTEIRLPFDGFRLQSFGRFLRNAPPLQPAQVESMGITLSDKQPGDFKLEIRAIRTAHPEPVVTGYSERRSDTPSDRVAIEVRQAAEAAGLTTLLQCVDAAGITLPATPVTVFAPTNAAFSALPEADVQRLLEPRNRAALRRLLGLHVVPGRVPASALLAGARLESVAGQRIESSIQQGRLTLGDDVHVVATDLTAGNVTIHQIDRVLLPTAAPTAKVADATERAAAAIEALDVRESAIAVYAAAIDRGAPLFNSGNIAACTAVYELAVDAMLLLGGRELGEVAFERLLIARRDGAQERSVRERAWLLRTALDETAAALQAGSGNGPGGLDQRR